jgi:hypothetical protein
VGTRSSTPADGKRPETRDYPLFDVGFPGSLCWVIDLGKGFLYESLVFGLLSRVSATCLWETMPWDGMMQSVSSLFPVPNSAETVVLASFLARFSRESQGRRARTPCYETGLVVKGLLSPYLILQRQIIPA